MTNSELAVLLELFLVIKKDVSTGGVNVASHDQVHDKTVQGYCRLIAPNRTYGAYAEVAALCHSTDRHFPLDNDAELRKRIVGYLSTIGMNEQEQTIVVEAVLNHHKPNDESDGPILMTLKDADRLANLGLPAVIRCGQHYNSLTTFDVRYVGDPDPIATYKAPLTVLHDVRSALEWDPREGKEKFCLRLPKAVKLATPYFDWLKMGLELAEHQIVETGVRRFFETL